jgi:hypothetical protein
MIPILGTGRGEWESNDYFRTGSLHYHYWCCESLIHSSDVKLERSTDAAFGPVLSRLTKYNEIIQHNIN